LYFRAVEDFYKQVEDYEQWKATTAAFSNDILGILPEFTMEKNQPIEDDDNLEKKDEW
jgi:hypothetical protein